MKKRVLSCVMAAAMMLTMAACGGSATSESSPAQSGAEQSKQAQSEEVKEEKTSDFVLVNGLDAIKEKGKLTIGLMAAIPPYEFHYINNGTDEIVGSDIELIKAICAELGVEYEIKDMEFSGLLASLQANKIDMIVSSMAPTLERQENADFSDVYYECDYYITIHKDSADTIKTAEDLAGKTIGVQATSTMEFIVDEQIPQATKKQIINASDLVVELNAKKVDGIITDIDTAKLYCLANPDFVMTDISYEASGDALGAAIAMPKGTDEEVKEVINGVIAEMRPKMRGYVDHYIEMVDPATIS